MTPDHGTDDVTQATQRLLRATLLDDRRRLDAAPGLVLPVALRANRLRRRRTAARALGLAGAVLVLVLASPFVVRLGRTTSPAGPGPVVVVASDPATPNPSPSPVPERGVIPMDVAAQDVQLTPGVAWVLTPGAPSTVQALNPRTGAVLRRAVLPVDGSYGGIRVDPVSGEVWVWRYVETNPRTSVIMRFTGSTLAFVQRVDVPVEITDLAAENGRVWFATGSDLFRLAGDAGPTARPSRTTASVAEPVPGTGGAWSVAADRLRGHLLVNLDGRRILALDPWTQRIVASASSSLGKASIAATGDGELWTAGYSASGPTVVQRDPDSLHLLGSTRQTWDTGPGALVWPGERVVWVRNGGDLGLTCLDAATGAPLGRWSAVQGPVVSTAGLALAVNDGQLIRLDLPSTCPG